MKKWLSLSLAFLLIFTFIPTAFSQANGKTETVKPSKVSGKVAGIDSASGLLELDANGKTIELVIDSGSKIQIAGMKNATASDIWVGDRSTVLYATVNNQNTIKTIHVAKQKGSLKGSVQAIDLAAPTLTVAGKTVVLLEKTDIRMGKEQLDAEEIAIGDKVEIKGFLKENVLQAFMIKVKREASVVKGEVELIDPESGILVVDGKDVNVTEETTVRLNGEEASLEDILPGDEAVAAGIKQGDVLAAKTVSIKRKPIEVKGTVESVDLENSTVTIDGITLTIDENTKIVADDEDLELDLLELAEGVEAKAKALQTGEDEWVALEMKVKMEELEEDDEDEDQDGDQDEEDEERKGEVDGRVGEIDPSAMTLTVNGEKILVTEKTVIRGPQDKKLKFTDIKMNAKAEAKGSWKDDVLVATSLKVENKH